MKDWKIYLLLASASIKSRMEYRGSFFIFTFTVILFYAAQLLTVGIVINRFQSIGGWSVGEMAFLYSLLILSQAVVSFLFSGILDFSTMVREGTYDRMLIRPISTMGQVIMGGFDVGGFANLIIGIATFILSNSFTNIQWNFPKVLMLILVVLGGSAVLGGIRIFIAAIAFYSINNQSLVHLFVYSSREFLLYPLNIYNFGLRFLLTFIVPLAFVNYYPAYLFLDKSGENLFHPLVVYGSLPAGIIVMVISNLFWKRSQRVYESAGA